MIEIQCNTAGCSWKAVALRYEDNGTEVVCSGECGNILRADNPEHPNYPEQPEPEPTLRQQILQLLVEEGVLPE